MVRKLTASLVLKAPTVSRMEDGSRDLGSRLCLMASKSYSTVSSLVSVRGYNMESVSYNYIGEGGCMNT